MTPEQWRRVTAVFHAARTRDPATRARYLDEECAGDGALRAEVDAMLAADGAPGGFGDTPLFDLAATRLHLDAGAMLAGYRIDARIGTGGMGEVYRAHDPRLDRSVAIKILYSGPSADPDARSRVLQEARSAAALNHPSICTIHEVGDAGPHAYIVLELIEGESLEGLISPSGLSIEDSLRYGVAVADAMAYAHHRGVLHGDLKPANVMICQHGIPKILDFGLAKFLSASEPLAAECPATSPADATRGTPSYMCPEQVRGQATDERSDIFSFGALLYEMLTGRPPFDGETPQDVLEAVLYRRPHPIAAIRPDVPAVLVSVVYKALEKNPSQRYQRMSDIAAHLRELQRPESSVQAFGLGVGVAATIAFFAIGVWLASHSRRVNRAESPGAPRN